MPANLGNSPASIAVNLRISRSFGLGPEVASAEKQCGPGRPPGGPGGFGGGSVEVAAVGAALAEAVVCVAACRTRDAKYSLTFSAQALNLFNDIDYGTPTGSVVPTLLSGSGATAEYGPGSRFDKSTSLAGGMFASSYRFGGAAHLYSGGVFVLNGGPWGAGGICGMWGIPPLPTS